MRVFHGTKSYELITYRSTVDWHIGQIETLLKSGGPFCQLIEALWLPSQLWHIIGQLNIATPSYLEGIFCRCQPLHFSVSCLSSVKGARSCKKCLQEERKKCADRVCGLEKMSKYVQLETELASLVAKLRAIAIEI